MDKDMAVRVLEVFRRILNDPAVDPGMKITVAGIVLDLSYGKKKER
jgi:hypothetical protein